ncbi:MAG: transglutaminase family protein [Chloroflexi bacterium]|nr:transglutaminase family protein [Chloroflexota bacterium]
MAQPNASALEQFALAAGCDKIDLAQMALLIAAAEYPDLDVKEELRALDSLAAGASRSLGEETDPLARVNRLSEYLFDEVGFRGNREDYYDPRNSFLNEVLSRRLGIPITLSLVYIEVGKRLGVPLVGVGMPGHFMVRINSGEEGLMIDPFHRGILLSEKECAQRLQEVAGAGVPWDRSYLAPVSNRGLIERILLNLRGIYGRRHDQPRALRAAEWLLALQSRSPLE